MEKFTTLDVNKLRNALELRFRYTFDKFRTALVEAKALLAGGGALAPYAKFPINDLDIYVHPQQAKQLITTLITTLNYKITKNELTPSYDQSFFKKNHILSRFRLVSNNDNDTFYSKTKCLSIVSQWWKTSNKDRSPKMLVKNYKKNLIPIRNAISILKQTLFENGLYSPIMMEKCLQDFINNQLKTDVTDENNDPTDVPIMLYEDFLSVDYLRLPDIDIMIVHPNYSLYRIVTNFDLTFCQIWYDGENVRTSHAMDIKTKKGVLQKDYVNAYANGNEFLLHRVKKYQKRGFSISIPDLILPKISHYNQTRTVSSPLEWVINMLYTHYFTFIHEPDTPFYSKVCDNPLTLESNDYKILDNKAYEQGIQSIVEDAKTIEIENEEQIEKIEHREERKESVYTFIMRMTKDQIVKAVGEKRIENTYSKFFNYLQSYLQLSEDEILDSVEMSSLDIVTIQNQKKQDDLEKVIDYEKHNKDIDKIKDDLNKRHPSITLLIDAHGSDNGFLDIPLQRLMDQRVQIAYMISSGALNFFDRFNYKLLDIEYISTPLSIQRSNSDIMDLFIENCKQNYIQNEYFIKKSYDKVEYKESMESAKRMFTNNQQCYRGKALVNRTYHFDDKHFFTRKSTLPDWIKDNSPFMGSIYVLRAQYEDGVIAKGDLLDPLFMDNRLQPLQIMVQDIIKTNDNKIQMNELLPLLEERFDRVYIYDSACRFRENKEQFTKIPSLQRSLSSFIYEEESKPILQRAPSIQTGSQTQLIPYQQRQPSSDMGKKYKSLHKRQSVKRRSVKRRLIKRHSVKRQSVKRQSVKRRLIKRQSVKQC